MPEINDGHPASEQLSAELLKLRAENNRMAATNVKLLELLDAKESALREADLTIADLQQVVRDQARPLAHVAPAIKLQMN